ncbi:MAG: hypothetical protein HQK81_06350 [Desulfovibrionaceae bacterium]|nr:hypothetical protein [Desulfovibrionaceae bacterium]MBF0513670.1 hypothetical protein [Desulfovibrionaceae bacterium]
MSKRQEGADKGLVQLTLPLSSLPTAGMRAGALRTHEAVKEALTAALARSGLDREYVTSELSRLVGENVSIHTINNWTSGAKNDRRLPLEYAAALAVILDDTTILEAALGGAGFMVLHPRDVPVFELGRLTVEERKHGRRKREVWGRIR